MYIVYTPFKKDNLIKGFATNKHQTTKKNESFRFRH
jgi:hypothetical protein